MRTILYRFDDLASFESALLEAEQDLALPEGERVADGEWVLAMFEVGKRKRATAAAARGMERGDGVYVLGFERRDWERLLSFSNARSDLSPSIRPVIQSEVPIPITIDTDGPPPSAASAPTDRPASPPASTLPSSIPVSSPGNRTSPIPSQAPSAGQLAASHVIPPPAAIPIERPSAPAVATAASLAAGPDSSQQRIPIPSGPASSGDRSRPSGPSMRTSGRFVAASNASVLVVDDDPDIRDVVGAMLESVGLVVETVESAEEALERVNAQHFDLVVLDWNLPKMSGIELCRQIRREARLSALPVLFLTSHASSKDIVEAFASGADDYVVKPFRAPELGARIFGLLRRARIAQASPG